LTHLFSEYERFSSTSAKELLRALPSNHPFARAAIVC
jgi:hypothetical protein